jgi:hypothetical protein
MEEQRRRLSISASDSAGLDRNFASACKTDIRQIRGGAVGGQV